MAVADPKRAAGASSGADGGAPRAQPAPAAVQRQARPDFGHTSSLSARSRPPAEGQVIEGYDVLADLDRLIAGDADDACRARLGAWHREQIREHIEQIGEHNRARIQAQIGEHNRARIQAQIGEHNRARIQAQIGEHNRARIQAQIHEHILEQIDYDTRVGIPRDLVRAYALPPVPEPS